MKFLIVVVAILGCLACTQAASKGLGERIECFRAQQAYNTRIYESRIRELVEGLRDQLKAGIPDKNVPPMDPLSLDGFRLQIDEEFAKLDWNMTGNINGLMSWDLTAVTLSLAGFKFTFTITFKEISGQGKFEIDGTLAELLPVYGEGEFDVLAENLVIEGSGKIGSRGSGEEQQLFLENFSIKPSLEKFTFGVTGLMGDEQLSFLLSQMISESLPDLIENFSGQIDSFASGKVIALADSVLNKMTMKDILDMLKPKPATTTTAAPEEGARWIDCGGY